MVSKEHGVDGCRWTMRAMCAYELCALLSLTWAAVAETLGSIGVHGLFVPAREIHDSNTIGVSRQL